MKIKNLIITKKVMSLVMAGTLVLSLSGCGNYDAFDTKYDYNKAIIFSQENKTATIVEIVKWTDYEGEQYQILTNDGLTMVTSSYDTKLIDDKTSKLSAEDIARSIIGNDVKITYLDEIAKSK